MTVSAYILIHSNLGAEEMVLDELKKIDEVKESHIVMGSYDLIALISVDETKQLRPLVTNKIRTIAGVRQTMTVIVV